MSVLFFSAPIFSFDLLRVIYGPLSNSDEKLRAQKNNTVDPPAAGLLFLYPFSSLLLATLCQVGFVASELPLTMVRNYLKLSMVYTSHKMLLLAFQKIHLSMQGETFFSHCIFSLARIP